MKTLELDQATAPLAEYAANLENEPVILTRGGAPFAALLSLEGVDLESLQVSASPVFWEIIQQSRAQMAAGQGIPSEEVRRLLGLEKQK